MSLHVIQFLQAHVTACYPMIPLHLMESLDLSSRYLSTTATAGSLHHHVLNDSGTFSECPQIYIKLTGFEDTDSGKLPFKYY